MTLLRTCLVLLLGALAFARAHAVDMSGTEVLGVRAGKGPGTMRHMFDPILVGLFAMDSRGRFALLDIWDGSGAVRVFSPEGKFLRRIPVTRAGERFGLRAARGLWVDTRDHLYVKLPLPQEELREFDPGGLFVRDFESGWVDWRGHQFLRPSEDTLEERDSDGRPLRRWTGTRHVSVDSWGGLVTDKRPAPPGIRVLPSVPNQGGFYRDRQGSYYLNRGEEGVCADFFKFLPTGELVWQLRHVELMKKLGYRHQEQEWIGGRPPFTKGGRFCTLGWYLSMQDEIFALAASDSVPRKVPWLRIIRVHVRDK